MAAAMIAMIVMVISNSMSVTPRREEETAISTLACESRGRLFGIPVGKANRQGQSARIDEQIVSRPQRYELDEGAYAPSTPRSRRWRRRREARSGANAENGVRTDRSRIDDGGRHRSHPDGERHRRNNRTHEPILRSKGKGSPLFRTADFPAT
jgi:hypothetical protein